MTQKADQRDYGLYLLLDIDVPFVEDWQRPDADNRKDFFERFKEELDLRKRNYILISGSYEERFQQAIKAIDALFSLS